MKYYYKITISSYVYHVLQGIIKYLNDDTVRLFILDFGRRFVCNIHRPFYLTQKKCTKVDTL